MDVRWRLLMSFVFIGMIPFSAYADPMPEMNLKEREYRGQAAIDALGKNLESVAKHYGKSAAELRRHLKGDRTMRIDRKGRIFYADEAPTSSSYFDQAPSPTADSIPEAQTFLLHSRPNAAAKIFLNFQGKTVENSMWNTSGPIVASPYSTDSDPSFSSTELRGIRETWLTVAEDFAPFNIDVTTEIPSTMPSTNSVEVLLTNSWEWYGQSGGVAYLNSFTWANQPRIAWVFNLQSIRNMAEAASHEAGHTFGLRHWASYDSSGTMTSSYSWGNGNWAPIMGAAYNARYATWSKGEYANSGTALGFETVQDDVGLIAAKAGYAPNDAGDAPSTASLLNGSVSAGIMDVNHASELSNETDVDVYRLDAANGTISLTVAPAAYDANSDIEASLLDSKGNVLAVSNQDLIQTETVSASLPAGTYYLKIRGVGFGDLVTGYASYGMRGRYTVIGSYVVSGGGGNPTPTPTPTPQPTATPTPTSPPVPPAPDSAPSVSMVSPVNGLVVPNRTGITLTAHASDDHGLNKVTIYVNGKAKCKFAASGRLDYEPSCSMDIRGKTGSSISIYAVATDNAGHSTQSSAISVKIQ